MKNKIIPIIIVWALLIGWGWIVLARYTNTPVQVAPTAPRWPAATKISRNSDVPMMVIFLHPHCPCSRASVAQLSSIMAHSQKKVQVTAVFVQPKNFSRDWVKTDLYKKAQRIPGVQVMIDEGGEEAQIFQVSVSGQVMLFDRSGQLVFNGGITEARGHEGDNAGQDSIISFLTSGKIQTKQTPSFGCLLLNDEK